MRIKLYYSLETLSAVLLLLCVLLAAGPAQSCGLERVAGRDTQSETFFIPGMPYPPEIKEVSNSRVVAGRASFTVYARIEGRTQYSVCCGDVCEHECETECDFSECGSADFYREPDPRVSPNPPCIPNINDTSGGENPSVCGGKQGNPRLFYYYGDEAGAAESIDMVYNTATGYFEADVPLNSSDQENRVTYYIAAADSMGNVVSQLPAPGLSGSRYYTDWISDLASPGMDNCTTAGKHERCGELINGAPSCSDSSFTVRDSTDDVCYEDINPFEDAGVVDITGFSARTVHGIPDLPSEEVLGVQVGMAEDIPMYYEGIDLVEVYAVVLYNPDIPDPNPADTHIENSIIIVYMPDMSGVDCGRPQFVLDGDCATDPDNYSCKIYHGSPSETGFVLLGSGDIKTYIKNSLPDGRTIIGNSSNEVRIIALTGGVDLSRGIYWQIDRTAPLSLLRENQVVDIASSGPLSPPQPVSPASCRQPGGGSYNSGVCPQSESDPGYNECYLTFHPSPDAALASEYRIYHNTSGDPGSAVHIDSVTTGLSETGNYTFTWGDDAGEVLNGQTHYFYFTAGSPDSSGTETPLASASRTYCTVEDWTPPAEAPEMISCATPAGSSRTCRCSWTADTINDPSISGFNIYREYVRLNTPLIPSLAGMQAYEYSFTDETDYLELGGGPYEYSVRAVDVAGNMSAPSPSGADTALCTPYDLEKPAPVDSLVVRLKPDAYGVDLSWEKGDNAGLEAGGGYNVYKCEVDSVSSIDCMDESDFTSGGYSEKINSSLIPHDAALELSSTDFPQENTEFCFRVEACDDCVARETCPGRSEPNCSSFDPSADYRKCLVVTTYTDMERPAKAENVTAAAPAQGGSCEITFDRVCADSLGRFDNCASPAPHELSGYYVMRTEAVAGDCSATPTGNPGNPGDSSFAETVSATYQFGETHTAADDNHGRGLTNGAHYCYAVYAFDSSGNYSPGEPEVVSCTPADTSPPPAPSMLSIDCDDTACVLDWLAAMDTEPVTYNVYRCGGWFDTCNSASGFSILEDNEGAVTGGGLTMTTLQDYTIAPEDRYTYCVTAVDYSGNESAVYDAAGPSNCSQASAAGAPYFFDVHSAWETPDNYGASACWDAAPGEDSGNGYNIYACSLESCDRSSDASCCEYLMQSGYTGYHACTLGSEWSAKNSGVESPGDYYIGVTHTDDSGDESYVNLSDNSIMIEPYDVCSSNPSLCSVKVELDTPLKQLKTEPCPAGSDVDTCCEGVAGVCSTNGIHRKIETPRGNVSIELVPVLSGDPAAGGAEYGAAVKTMKTDDAGRAEFPVPYTDITSTEQYVVRVKLNAEDVPMTHLCDNNPADDGFCALNITEPQVINTTGERVDISARPDVLPAAPSDGGFTGDIGNFNADDIVNARDLLKMKPAWNTSAGDPCYRSWADVNLDGRVNAVDLLAIKDYWMKEVDSSGINTGAPGAMIPEDGWPPPECQ